MILRTIIDIIEDDSAVMALIDNVWPLVYPSGADLETGVITARVISGFQVGSVAAEQVWETRIQLDVWTYDYTDTDAIAIELQRLFHRYDGVAGSGDGHQQRIIDTTVDLVFDTFEQNIKAHRKVVDLRVTHEAGEAT